MSSPAPDASRPRRLEVRTATLADVPAIRELCARVYPDEPPYYFIRVVALDPFLNKTDLLIPIVVIDTTFRVDTLGVESRRQQRKRKGR